MERSGDGDSARKEGEHKERGRLRCKVKTRRRERKKKRCNGSQGQIRTLKRNWAIGLFAGVGWGGRCADSYVCAIGYVQTEGETG